MTHEQASRVVRSYWESGDRHRAVTVAAKATGLGTYRRTILRGAHALKAPTYWREVGDDPDVLVQEAVQAVALVFGLKPAA